MASFYIYETKTLHLKLSRPEALENYKEIVVSLNQAKTNTQIDFSGDQLEVSVPDGLISLYLDQETTSKFSPGSVTIQVNIYYQDKERDVSTTTTVKVLSNLYKKVIS